MSKKRILIVEDDADVRQGMQVRLQANDFDTYVAVDAIESISQARKHSPDLIILDLGLPGGDGFVVMERFKSIAAIASIPIIVVSARDPSINRERAIRAGAKAFLQKPVENVELIAVVQRTLGELAPEPTVYDI